MKTIEKQQERNKKSFVCWAVGLIAGCLGVYNKRENENSIVNQNRKQKMSYMNLRHEILFDFLNVLLMTNYIKKRNEIERGIPHSHSAFVQPNH